MSNTLEYATVLLKGDTAANLTSSNPILLKQEILIETDTHYYKIGDGTTAWNNLPYVTPPAASTTSGGVMSATDKAKLDAIEANANNYSLPTATDAVLGGVKIGDNISISNGVISTPMGTTEKTKLQGIDENANNYSLPTATANTLGGIKVGSNLSVTNEGVLSGATQTSINSTSLGTGNVITDISIDSTGVITPTKGFTAATASSVTAGNTGSTSASTAVSFNLPHFTVTSEGVISSYGTHTHTIPEVSESSSGVMPATDKVKLNKLDWNRFSSQYMYRYVRNEWWTLGKTSITFPSYMEININAINYVQNGAITLDLSNSSNWDSATYATAANRAGKDFYIYACATSGYAPKFLLSASSTIPSGYTANNSRKIGGFHCLCLSIGTISGHTLSGYSTGDIIPNSLWDINFHAKSSNIGMVYIDGIGKWADIYLPSKANGLLTSVYGGVIIDGSTSVNGIEFFEQFGLVNKEPISYREFVVMAKGSNEKTNIAGSSDPNTTGGHTDTAGRRMTSNFGLEDCCGVLWQWGRDLLEGDGTKGTYTSGNTWLDGYSWNEYAVGSDYGQCDGLLRVPFFGGCWDGSTYCGSRSISCRFFPADRYGVVSSRGVSETLGKK